MRAGGWEGRGGSGEPAASASAPQNHPTLPSHVLRSKQDCM